MGEHAEPRIQVPVRRAANGQIRDEKDWVAREEPLEIRVGFSGAAAEPETLVITMRTPGHDEDLACGLLFTEGLVDGAADIIGFTRGAGIGAERDNVAQIQLGSKRTERFQQLKRNFYANSSCGICGKASLEALRARAHVEVQGEGWTVSEAVLRELPGALVKHQLNFAYTGGLHAAAAFEADGTIGDVREDVGRHNAMDKLIGAALRQRRLPFRNAGILVSGRASFEIIEKARMAGCPLVVAVGAPSSLAIDAAWECGITLIGFLRDGRFNIYSVPARIAIDHG